MPRPVSGFLGKRVSWHGVKSNHDNSTLMPIRHHGLVLETHWDNTTLWCIVVDPSGILTQHEVTDLTLTNSPLAATHPS